MRAPTSLSVQVAATGGCSGLLGLLGNSVPPPSSVKAAATKNEQDNEDDQKCRRVDDDLLRDLLSYFYRWNRWSEEARNLLMFPTRYDGFEIPPSKCDPPGCPIGRQHDVEMEFDMVRELEKG
jgi:hypothetical protein